jgi:hypothetical protein
MKRSALLKLGSVLAAAVAVFVVPAALSQPPSIINSFPLTGATPPSPRGIHYYNAVFVISYTAPGYNYLYQYSLQGSFISSYLLPGASVISETDCLPETYPRYYFSALDTATHDVKIYTTAASLVGTFMAAPSDAVAIGVGGHVTHYIYLATSNGLIRRYSPEGSFLGSFNTGVAVGDLAASGGYATRWGYFVQLAPFNLAGPIYSFWSWSPAGSLAGTFSLPGSRSCGAEVLYTSYYSCLRQVGSALWVYRVDLGRGMAVGPASLGKVKALFR